jgi:hypothetical protein
MSADTLAFYHWPEDIYRQRTYFYFAYRLATHGQLGQLSPHSGGVPAEAPVVAARNERVKVRIMMSFRILL